MIRLLVNVCTILFLVVLANQALAQSTAPISYAPEAEAYRSDPGALDLILEARLTDRGAPIEDGLIWRVFSAETDQNDRLKLMVTANGGTTGVQLKPGDYVIHAAYGRASATRKVSLGEVGKREVFNMEAGGLRLAAVSGTNKPIQSKELTFSVYSVDADEKGERKLIARDIPHGQIVRLNAGTYHVESAYGGINASVRADLKVQPGKLTDATLQHQAAEVSFKLVTKPGGEPLADTAWSFLTEAGDAIKESATPSPTLILAEGTYSLVVKNGETIFTKDFIVSSGINETFEVLAVK